MGLVANVQQRMGRHLATAAAVANVQQRHVATAAAVANVQQRMGRHQQQ